ncbi:response regulator, partial [Pseudomonas sp. CrR25]|nr:response regulator [Pseudomonas sp. CrR25]
MFDNAEILIVEDSPTQATELQYLLESSGCQVRVARNGVEALECIAERPPTIVISDIVMPEMDGYELCRRLKGSKDTASIPVILVTSLADARDVVHGLACGADNFIVKPYDEKYLMSRIRYFLVNLELRSNERVQMGVEV